MMSGLPGSSSSSSSSSMSSSSGCFCSHSLGHCQHSRGSSVVAGDGDHSGYHICPHILHWNFTGSSLRILTISGFLFVNWLSLLIMAIPFWTCINTVLDIDNSELIDDNGIQSPQNPWFPLFHYFCITIRSKPRMMRIWLISSIMKCFVDYWLGLNITMYKICRIFLWMSSRLRRWTDDVRFYFGVWYENMIDLLRCISDLLDAKMTLLTYVMYLVFALRFPCFQR